MNKRTPDSAKVRIAKTLTAGNLQRAIDGYLQDSRMRMQSPRTIEQKQEHTGKLVWYIQRERLAVVDEACISSFLSYILTAHTNPLGRWETAGAGPVCNVTAAKRPVRRNTIRSYFTTLRAFFRWCIERRILDESPMALLKPPVKQQRPPVPLTVDHISRLIEAAARSRQSARDVAVVWLLFDAGLRRFELTALKIADVDQYSNRLTVRHGKGDKERVVYMGRKCGDALWTYLSTRGGAASDEALFEAKDGGHLQNGGLSQLIRRLGEAAGITDVHVSTHKLRHSYAVEKLAAGCTDLTLMRSMGHSTLDSTKAYSHFSADMMQRMHHQFSPGDQINAGRIKKGRRAFRWKAT